MTEANIQKKLLDKLAKAGWYAIKVVSANRAGVPDILACAPGGEFYGIECKRPGKDPTPLQAYHGSEIEAAGGRWFVHDGKDRIFNPEAVTSRT